MNKEHPISALFDVLGEKKQHIVFHLRLKPLTVSYLESKILTHYPTREALWSALEQLRLDGVVEIAELDAETGELSVALTDQTKEEMLPILLSVWQWSWDRIVQKGDLQ